MDLFEALKGRRSVRAYKDEQIKDEELNSYIRSRGICCKRNG